MNIQNSSLNKYQLSKEIVENAIYLDFEGEGKKLDGTIPCPHMAGLYRPYTSDYKYSSLFFKFAWKPVKAGHNNKNDKIGDFYHLIAELIEEAERENRRVIYWTIHEEKIIEIYTPDLLERFIAVGINLHKPAKKYAKQRALVFDENEEKGLNQFLKAIKRNSSLIEKCRPTAAEACRRLDNYSTNNKRWRNWSMPQKRVARDLLRYNREDCLGILRLARKFGNSTF